MRCVVVGDCGIGKTDLCRLLSGQCIQEEVQDEVNHSEKTMLDIWPVSLPGNELQILDLFDTSGDDFFQQWRILGYDKADLCMICYAVDSPDSLNNVLEKWYQEKEFFGGNMSTLLVGLKSELRDPFEPPTPRNSETVDIQCEDGLPVLVSKAEVESMGKLIEASHVIECSVATGENMELLLSTTSSIVQGNYSPRPSRFFNRFVKVF